MKLEFEYPIKYLKMGFGIISRARATRIFISTLYVWKQQNLITNHS